MPDSPVARVSRPHGPFIGREFNFRKRRHGYPFHKTEAELSLLGNLQGNNQVTAPNQAKSASVPNTKGPDVKPRLLLMGLRRQVSTTSSRIIEILTVVQEWKVLHRQCGIP